MFESSEQQFALSMQKPIPGTHTYRYPNASRSFLVRVASFVLPPAPSVPRQCALPMHHDSQAGGVVRCVDRVRFDSVSQLPRQKKHLPSEQSSTVDVSACSSVQSRHRSSLHCAPSLLPQPCSKAHRSNNEIVVECSDCQHGLLVRFIYRRD